jgi:hypothetical protein
MENEKSPMLYETPREDGDKVVKFFYWLGAWAVVVVSAVIMILTFIYFGDGIPIWVREFLG